MTLNVVGPTTLSQFLNGHFQGKYIDEAGMFTLTSLKFCIRGEPLQPGVCPAKDVQHWDKIVFMITSPDIARRVNLTVNTELDIKVLDDPHKVSDVKQKVLDFLKIPTVPKARLKDCWCGLCHNLYYYTSFWHKYSRCCYNEAITARY